MSEVSSAYAQINAQRVFYGNTVNQLDAQQTFLNGETTQLAQQQSTIGGADLFRKKCVRELVDKGRLHDKQRSKRWVKRSRPAFLLISSSRPRLSAKASTMFGWRFGP